MSKTKGTYAVKVNALGGGELTSKDVTGELIEFFTGVDVVIWKSEKSWAVHEAKTGLRIGPAARTRTAALEKAREMVETAGHERTLQVIEQTLAHAADRSKPNEK